MPGERPVHAESAAGERVGRDCTRSVRKIEWFASTGSARSRGVRIARRLDETGAGGVTNEGRNVDHVDRLVHDPVSADA
jgi:hypothetical protein